VKHRRQRRARHRRTSLLRDHSLAGRASRALGWSVGSTVLSKISLFGVGIVLARLLGPHAFGTYAVAYVALLALLNFNDLGVSLAIVRWPGDPAKIIPTVTTLSVLGSVLIFAGCFFVAPVYAAAMGASSATGVVRVLALAVLSDAFTNVPAAVLQRTFRQGKRTIADQVNVWLGTAVTIALAWHGFGPMSLAVGRVAGCVASAVLLVAFAPESLRLGFDRTQARALLRFGLPLAGANVVAFAVGTADQLVVGRVLGTVALGFYVLALNIASWPIAFFSQPLRTVGPAVFARIKGDGAALGSTFVSAAGLLCAVSLPFCLSISGSARPLISVVYGIRWLPAARPLIWLAVLAAVQVFFFLAYDLFVVLARARFLLVSQLLWLGALVPALAAGGRADGLSGAALAELAVAAVLILPLYVAQLSKAGIRFGDLAAHLRLPFAGGLITGLVAAAGAVALGAVPALAVSGIAAGLILGVLAHRLGPGLAKLRHHGAESAGLGSHGRARPGPDPNGAMLTATMTLPVDPFPAGPGSGSQNPYHTVLRDICSYPQSALDPAATSPLYRLTVAELGWDPAMAARVRAVAGPADAPASEGTA
jgi:O-antigen/teichoic acid export membrane protein